MPAVADSPLAPESADASGPSRLSAGESTPVIGETPTAEDGPPTPVSNPRDDDGLGQAAGIGAGEVSEADQADQVETMAVAENAADPAPPLLGSAMTPNARQKLAEARKGRSRVRFLIIALVLMIVAVVAVSFIRRPDSLSDALRMVPGLDEGSPDESGVDENAGGAQ